VAKNSKNNVSAALLMILSSACKIWDILIYRATAGHSISTKYAILSRPQQIMTVEQSRSWHAKTSKLIFQRNAPSMLSWLLIYSFRTCTYACKQKFWYDTETLVWKTCR